MIFAIAGWPVTTHNDCAFQASSPKTLWVALAALFCGISADTPSASRSLLAIVEEAHHRVGCAVPPNEP
jgi:hypothetical protein